MFEEFHDEVGGFSVEAMSLVLSGRGADGCHIAIGDHFVFLLEIEFLSIEREQLELLNLFSIRLIVVNLALDTTDIREVVAVVVVTSDEHLSEFLTCEFEHHGVVAEGIEL